MHFSQASFKNEFQIFHHSVIQFLGLILEIRRRTFKAIGEKVLAVLQKNQTLAARKTQESPSVYGVYGYDEVSGYNDVTKEDCHERFTPRSRNHESSARDGESGVAWKFVNQGLSLLNLAISESRSPKLINASAARQFYLHSLTYLIHALPSDLTIDEKLSIQDALPHGILDSLDTNPKSLPPSYQQLSCSVPEKKSASLLHRVLACTIVQLFLLFQFLWPYLKLLLIKAWAFEREHQLILRLTKKGVDLGLNVGEVMRSMGEGRIGEMLAGSMDWILMSIFGGIEEAMKALLSKRNIGGLFASKMG